MFDLEDFYIIQRLQVVIVPSSMLRLSQLACSQLQAKGVLKGITVKFL